MTLANEQKQPMLDAFKSLVIFIKKNEKKKISVCLTPI